MSDRTQNPPKEGKPHPRHQAVKTRLGRPIALYVHVPFCETRCPYCDFNTYAGIEHLMPSYMDALVNEVRLWGAALGGVRRQQVGTVFFGGGTPSYLPPEALSGIMDTVRDTFDLAKDAEVTMESNPDDVTPARLASWRRAGFNRLSIGVQSLDDGLLQLLGRRHDAEGARKAYRAAQAAGFDNMNLDLMYGLPEQTLDVWRSTLAEMLDMAPAHLSLYCLTLEEGTPLATWVRQGKFPEPDPDLAADMYLLAEAMAGQAGYEHYEISNWALPGQECRHNLVYWRNQPYLGVGPGAHSCLGGYRFADQRSPRQYIQQMKGWTARSDGFGDLDTLLRHGPLEMAEAVGPKLEMGETMMLGLRLDEGVSDREFRDRFGTGVRDAYDADVAELEELGLLLWQGDRLRLTQRGRLLGNQVFQRFLKKD